MEILFALGKEEKVEEKEEKEEEGLALHEPLRSSKGICSCPSRRRLSQILTAFFLLSLLAASSFVLLEQTCLKQDC